MKLIQSITPSQATLIKNLGTSEHVRVHNRFLKVEYPRHFTYRLMLILVNCLKSFKIDKEIFDFTKCKVLHALIFLGCPALLELYCKKLLEINISLKQTCKCLSVLIETYGYERDHSSNHDIVRLFLNRLLIKGIEHSFLEKFLVNKYKLKIDHCLDSVDSLIKEWKEFWKNKNSTKCIFCKFRLTTMRVIHIRMKFIRTFSCCQMVACIECFQKAIESKALCPNCHTSLNEYPERQSQEQQEIQDIEMAMETITLEEQ